MHSAMDREYWLTLFFRTDRRLTTRMRGMLGDFGISPAVSLGMAEKTVSVARNCAASSRLLGMRESGRG